MKKVIITLAVAAFSLPGYAQKGSWYLGGNVGFNSTTESSTDANGETTDGGKQTNWSFSPEAGTFLTNHIQLGAGITLAGSKYDARTKTKNTSVTTQTGVTIYSRYFFGEGNFRPFAGVNVYVLPGSEKETRGTVETKYSIMNFGANLNAGFGYGLNSRVTVVGSFGALGFSKTTRKPEGSDAKQTTSSFGLDAGSLGDRFNVGIYYTL